MKNLALPHRKCVLALGAEAPAGAELASAVVGISCLSFSVSNLVALRWRRRRHGVAHMELAPPGGALGGMYLFVAFDGRLFLAFSLGHIPELRRGPVF